MTYEEAIAYIDETPNFAKKNPLEHTQAFLHRLGDPEETMRIIHAAGTNGKGSVCAFLDSVLRAKGIHTGLFTSPHLLDICERFQIDGEQVSREDFLAAFLRVYECIREMKKEGYPHPSYFELLFLIGMILFADKKVDALVLETGMGGRRDATNAIRHPVMTVITSISLDHTEYLGNTVAEIAAEKAGILKPGVPVVYDASDSQAAAVITARAEELAAPAFAVTPQMYRRIHADGERQQVLLSTGYFEDTELTIESPAEYQAMNAALAVTAIRVITSAPKTAFDDDVIRRGIAAMRWPGRMETVLPGVVLDGAHNEAGVAEFVRTADRLSKNCRLTLLFAAVGDKDHRRMVETIVRELRPDAVIVTEAGGHRRTDARSIAKLFREFGAERATAVPDVSQAFNLALRERGDGRLFCVGSLYLVGEIKGILKCREP